MDALELTGGITALANAIACRLTADEINFLSCILVQLGDTLSTIVARRGLCGENSHAMQ